MHSLWCSMFCGLKRQLTFYGAWPGAWNCKDDYLLVELNSWVENSSVECNTRV